MKIQFKLLPGHFYRSIVQGLNLQNSVIKKAYLYDMELVKHSVKLQVCVFIMYFKVICSIINEFTGVRDTYITLYFTILLNINFICCFGDFQKSRIHLKFCLPMSKF